MHTYYKISIYYIIPIPIVFIPKTIKMTNFKEKLQILSQQIIRAMSSLHKTIY